ncbi:hypothetical protein [Micromonospora sp. KC213]|uniref:hypothetical protein n=1 Tax=Micromonospora sp. KC213 TaxID=2530378 RepID=UPI00104365EC|nr:hypothetical protein [Micromonospora sp. KC213]TDC42109.1 hypothetical protein E1166_09130 [Micromonospora sp. KC213]
MIWPFRWRRRRHAQIDLTGPATRYGQRAGAYPAPAAPSWDGPTLIPTVAPLMTPGQRHRTQ